MGAVVGLLPCSDHLEAPGFPDLQAFGRQYGQGALLGQPQLIFRLDDEAAGQLMPTE